MPPWERRQSALRAAGSRDNVTPFRCPTSGPAAPTPNSGRAADCPVLDPATLSLIKALVLQSPPTQTTHESRTWPRLP